MKEKTKSSIKRSLSTVSKHKLNGNAGSVATRDESNCSPTPTQSTMSTYSSVGSLGREGSLQRPLAPPPPPPTITKPSCAPPPPPPQRENKCDKVKRSDTLTPLKCSTTTTAKDHDQNTNDNCEVQIVSQCLQPKVRPVDEVTTNFEDFKIDLKVESVSSTTLYVYYGPNATFKCFQNFGHQIFQEICGFNIMKMSFQAIS